MACLAKSPKDKLSLIDKDLAGDHYLPLKRQAELLGLSRSSLYYQRAPEVSEEDKALMDEIDKIYTKHPFFGTRRIRQELKKVGLVVCRQRIAQLMQSMGIEAIYPKPNLSLNCHDHPVFPYLLKGLKVVRVNQVWGIDITYIKLSSGFVYLVAIIDWYSRFVVDYEISIGLDNEFVISCLKRAFSHGVTPEILNSDQGVQFTSKEYIELLTSQSIQISMDHKGRCFDNIFVERLWRSVKYEEVYLKSYASVREAIEGLSEYFHFYNYDREHSSLEYQTPNKIYFGHIKPGEEVTKENTNLGVLVS